MANLPAEVSVELILSDAEYSEEVLEFNLPLAVTAVNDSNLSESDESLLKAFIKHMPSKEGCFNVVSAIIECDGAEILEQLASWLRRLSMCVRSSGSQTPAIGTPSTFTGSCVRLSFRAPQPVKASRSWGAHFWAGTGESALLPNRLTPREVEMRMSQNAPRLGAAMLYRLAWAHSRKKR